MCVCGQTRRVVSEFLVYLREKYVSFDYLLINVMNFIFREFAWFAPTEEMIDDAKIRDVHALQHNAVDFLVLLVICGLLFAITILSGNSPKNEASDYNARSIETISMAFEDDPSSFWYSRSASSGLTSCFHSCDNLAGRRSSRRDIVPEVQDISRRQSTSKRKITPRSITANCIARPSRSQHSQKTSRNSRTAAPREWLVRRTRSGHVYGKYPM